MNDLIYTALVMAGVFVVCYPIVVFMLNRITAKLEVEQNKVKTVS